MATGKGNIKIAFIGGGSENWTANIVRDIIFKEGMEDLVMEFALLDVDMGRAQAIHDLFQVKLAEWGVDRVRTWPTLDAEAAIADADFVIITISTGRLPAMKHDLEIPDKYGIYHTVGDTCGPGGWARALRNIPVFKAYAEQIRKLAPAAHVLNYTNPMGALTKVLSDELEGGRVVGLCHGLFECYEVLKAIFELESEEQIHVRFGGVNHFFWILDMKINGADGYPLFRDKLQGRNFATLVKEIHRDGMGFGSDKWLAGELFDNYGYLPYVGDRHTCEFFGCYITSQAMMERFKLVRTSIAQSEDGYRQAADRIRKWTRGEEADDSLDKKPSRETAADIIRAITFNEGFADVVNTVNTGQIPNLPLGGVVETMGYIDGRGFTPFTVGPLPDTLRPLLYPHVEVQIRTVAAGLSGDLNEALLALAADPACAHMTVSDVKKMGRELLEANRQYLPQFFGS